MSRYQAFAVDVQDAIAHVRINRPEKINAMNADFWAELPVIFQSLEDDPSVRVVVLSGEGAHFSAGIDLALLAGLAAELGKDVGRNARLLRKRILTLQAALDSVARYPRPVLAAVHGYCLGAGVDLIAACDLRYASACAQVSIKEIDMGMAADVGTLQRLPRLIGEGPLRELAYTGRRFDAEEGRALGLFNRVYADKPALLDGVFAIAREIASKSPLAVAGTKRMIDYMRDHRIEDGLEYVATWNAAMLQSPDLRLAMAASLSKQQPAFDD